MNSGEVYEVHVDFYSDNGIRIKKGDIIEIIHTMSRSGPNYTNIGRYHDMNVMDVLKSHIEQNCYCVSPTPLDRSHPLRNHPGYHPVPIMYPGRSAILPGYGLQGIDPGPPIIDEHSKKCECGCASIGVNNHSDYCPLYSKE